MRLWVDPVPETAVAGAVRALTGLAAQRTALRLVLRTLDAQIVVARAAVTAAVVEARTDGPRLGDRCSPWEVR